MLSSFVEAVQDVALPLPGREREYEMMLRFISRRWTSRRGVSASARSGDLALSQSLFVFGACGCGKTTTILRALRLCVDRPIPSDPIRAAGQVNFEAPQGGKVTGCKRFRSPSTSAVDYPSPPTSSKQEGVETVEPMTSSRAHWASRYSQLATPAKSVVDRVLGHYINCADLNGTDLTRGLIESVRKVCPRPDPASRVLCEVLEELGKAPRGTLACSQHRGKMREERAGMTLGPLHVIVMDEVEYSHPSAQRVLTELTNYAARHPEALALVFISNQRHLVHVPPAFLEDLCFEAYRMEQLQQITSFSLEASLQELVSEGKLTLDQRNQIQITRSLITYIARKTLQEFSGDARQVIAMSRRVVFAGLAHLTTDESAESTPRGSVEAARSSTGSVGDDSGAALEGTRPRAARKSSRRSLEMKRPTKNASAAKRVAASVKAGPAVVSSKFLQSVVDSFEREGAGGKDAGPRPASLGDATPRSSSHSFSSTRTSTSSQPDAASSVPSVTSTLSLATTMPLLRTCVVEEQAERYIATMTEQMAYVLSCLVVLRLQQETEQRLKMSSIGGSTEHGKRSLGKTSNLSSSISLRELHALYAMLMSRRHFPSMNLSGIASALDALSDISIITKPQKRGNEVRFSFNGTWSLEAMEAALTSRGEGLRKEMEACGLDGSENRFASVLTELKRIVGMIP